MIISNAIRLRTPLSAGTLKKLRAGQWVLLSGTIYTARDQAHRKLNELIRGRRRLPFGLKGAIIYYSGPTPARPGKIIGSAGPTTSSRMDGFTPQMLKLGLAAVIGKGERSEAVKESIRRHRRVYFVTVGGAGAYLAQCVTAAEVVAWPELGAEAVRKLTVRDFPCLVAYDAAGGDCFENARKTSRRRK